MRSALSSDWRVCQYVGVAEIDAMASLQRLARLAQPDLLGDLFPKQRAFVEDPSRFKAALCTRRAGKTFGVGRYLVRVAMSKAHLPTAYVTLTRFNAKRYMWPAIHRMKAARGLPCELNESDLMAKFDNGSSILLVGADDARKVERLRGDGYALVTIDEPGSFPQQLLGYLLQDVIEPALMDHRGTLALTGTPSPVPSGTFYDATTTDAKANGGRWSVHRWSMLDNPHMHDVGQEQERVLRDNHWTREHPKFRREYLGEWVRDLGSLVYPYDPQRNHVDRLPDDGEWVYTLGIDYGTTQDCAFAVWAWRRRVPHECWLVECWKRPGMLPRDAALVAKELSAKYRFSTIVGDAGGLGKPYVEEARRIFGVPIRPAQKQAKRAYIELMSGELKAGNIRVVGSTCAQWIDEAEKLQWEDESHEAEHPGFANHCLDAALYGYREAKAWNEKAPAAPLTEEQRILKAVVDRSARMKRPWYAR